MDSLQRGAEQLALDINKESHRNPDWCLTTFLTASPRIRALVEYVQQQCDKGHDVGPGNAAAALRKWEQGS